MKSSQYICRLFVGAILAKFTGKVSPWGRFIESPGNFSGPKSNIKIEISKIKARVLASKLLQFVSLTDSFVMSDAKLLKPLSCM